MLLNALLASLFILSSDVGVSKSAPPYKLVADTVYISPSAPYRGSFELHGRDERIFWIAPKKVQLRDGVGGQYADCSTRTIKCYDGVVHLIVNKAALLSSSEYNYLSFKFTPYCLYKVFGRCALAVIKYDEITNYGIGESGLFMFQDGFGVKWFAYTDPDSGALKATFYYVRGAPLLDDRKVAK